MIDMTIGSDAFKPKVGVSACLLGQKVRYDGDPKRDFFLTETLSRFVNWVPISSMASTSEPCARILSSVFSPTSVGN